jgi:hypothetical protein
MCLCLFALEVLSHIAGCLVQGIRGHHERKHANGNERHIQHTHADTHDHHTR